MQNITDLRNDLLDNYKKMKAGKMDIKLGKELTNTAGKVINSLKVELEYNGMMDNKEKIAFLDSSEDK